jgi:predicted transcriptional regulator
MAEEKTRVDFNAPASLVNRADSVADILDVSRTRLLIDALEDELDELASDDAFRRRVQDAYYEGHVEFDTVEAILGRETALRVKLLRDSLDQEPPEPQLDGDLPTDEAFYDGAVPEWQPAESAQDESGD